MPIAEIEFPLAGAILGPDFEAGGVYDLAVFTRRRGGSELPPAPASEPAPGPGTPTTIAVRCKLLDSSSTEVARQDFTLPEDGEGGIVPQGTWDVRFSISVNVPGGKLSSYLVDSDGTEHDGEMVIDLNVSNDAMGGGDFTVELDPMP